MKRYRLDLRRVCTNIMIISTIFVLFNAIGNFTFGSKNIETKTIKFLEEHLCDLGIGKDFWGKTLNVQSIKQKMDKLTYEC